MVIICDYFDFLGSRILISCSRWIYSYSTCHRLDFIDLQLDSRQKKLAYKPYRNFKRHLSGVSFLVEVVGSKHVNTQ